MEKRSSGYKTRSAPPRAAAMLGSLRGLGYSCATALADIVDNSISAGADTVDIQFEWAGTGGVDSHIYVLDNGCGMNDAELQSAMTLGDKGPEHGRASSDLGRFGIGLKTASFSQCQRLSVASKKNGVTSCLRWDLELISTTPAMGWELIEGMAPGSEKLLTLLDDGRKSGTLVVWELLDRIVTPGFRDNDFLDLIDHVEQHLAMVFHRYLECPDDGGDEFDSEWGSGEIVADKLAAKPPLRLRLNGRDIVPWNPFLDGHPAKPWASPVQRRGGIAIQGHVLPHKDKLGEEEYRRAAGPEGWNAQQGFYVYRNRRLLVAGGWLGLGAGGAEGRRWNREAPYQLARIMLDIPNSADAQWKIDVKKSTARPPAALRDWLTRMAQDTRKRARDVFAWRGSPASPRAATQLERAWRVEHSAKGVRYRIDIAHPAVAAVLQSAAPAHRALLKSMLRVIEETVPVQKIWLDTAEQKAAPLNRFAGCDEDAVLDVMRTLFADMRTRQGLSVGEARAKLARTEPFQNFPQLIALLS